MATKCYELIEQVKKLCLISGTTEDTNILCFMNLIQWEVYNINFRWRCLEAYPTVSTSLGVAYVTVPTTLGMVYDVRLSPTTASPYGRISYIDPHKFQELIPVGATPVSGKPEYYTWWSGRFYFYPTPDATYVLTVYGYNKPIGMKVYATGTATLSGTTVTGSSTYFSNNANVDTTMSFAYPADARSDGVLPWSAISVVGSNTSLTIATYAGVTASGAYACSSGSSFSEDFDQLLILGAAIMHTARLREIGSNFMSWLQQAYSKAMTGLLDSQTHVPDYTPALQRYIPGQRDVLGDPINKTPVLPRELLGA